jgi:hypothetical protein
MAKVFFQTYLSFGLETGRDAGPPEDAESEAEAGNLVVA